MTDSALNRLVAAVADAKREDSLAPVTVLVPSNLAGRTVGWALAAGLDGRRAVAGIRITTLARLAESVAAIRLHPRRPLLPTVLAAAWHSELEPAATQLVDWEFAGIWDHPATVAALVRAYRDLREVPEGLLPHDQLGMVSAETVRLASLVRRRLAADWYDQPDLYAEATMLVGEDPGAFAEFGVFVRYLEAEEPLSARTFRAALENGPGVVSVAPDEPKLAERVLHASDSDDEVRAVVREVVASLKGDQPARRLAILYSRPDPYVRIIHAQLAAAGIEFNGRGGLAVAELASCRAFLGLLDLPGRQFPRPLLFEVLSTWPVREFGTGDPVPTVTWERISRKANVAGAEPVATGWVRRLDHFAAQDRNQASQDDALALRDFVVTLDERLRELDAAATWEAVSVLALALLDDLFGGVDAIKLWHHDERRAFVTLRSALQGLRSLDAFRPPGGVADLLEVLTAQLEAAVPRTGTFGRGVFVGPIDQARGLDLDRVWVLGLSEDLYPGRQSEDALLPDPLRGATPGLESAHDRVGRRERDLVAAFGCGTHVTASFPRGDLRASAEKLPSRLLLPSLRELVGKPKLAATEWQNVPPAEAVVEQPSHAAGVRLTTRPATEQEWAMRHVLQVRGAFADPVFRAARELRIDRFGAGFTRFDGNLSGLPGLPDLAAGEDSISPTSLESYAKCPFAYFVSKLLRVEPVEEPSAQSAVSALDVGNIFHYAMDRFIRAEKGAGTLPGPGEPWSPEHYQRLDGFASAVIEEFAEQGRLGHPTLWSFKEPGIRADLVKMLADDSSWRADNGAAPIDSELAFGMGEEPLHPAVEIAVDGGTVLFRGSADKIDRAGDTVFITDIKTGRVKQFRKIDPKRGTPNPTVDGTKLQLPVYARAAHAANRGATEVQAQYWFVHGGDAGERVRLNLTSDLEETYSRVVGALVTGIARGHFFKKPSKDPGYLWVDCEYCTPNGAGHEGARRAYLGKRQDPALLELLEVIDPEGAEAVREGVGPDVDEEF